jgi:hypothetical protein
MADLVQIRIPRTNRYTKIDRGNGVVLGTKATEGPYKGIPIFVPADPKLRTAEDTRAGEAWMAEVLASKRKMLELLVEVIPKGCPTRRLALKKMRGLHERS